MISKNTVQTVAPVLAMLFEHRNIFSVNQNALGEAKEIFVSVTSLNTGQLVKITEMYTTLVQQGEVLDLTINYIDDAGMRIRFFDPTDISDDDLPF